MSKDNYWIIYTLKLDNSRWYVGSTTTRAFRQRMKDHWKGTGSEWTSEHKPITVYDIDVHPRELPQSEVAMLEDRQTLHMAKIFGTYCVRGGGFCQTITEPEWPLDFHVKVKKPKRKKRKDVWGYEIAVAGSQLGASRKLFK